MQGDINRASLTDLISSGVDHLTIVISRDQVEGKDVSATKDLLQQLIGDIAVAKYFRERVEIIFDGYNETRDELWEIPAVRNCIAELDAVFPYWLYFLSKQGMGLNVILKCFLLPFLKPEVEKQVNAPRLQDYLMKRGFPAMNKLCEITKISPEENIEMTNRIVMYIDSN